MSAYQSSADLQGLIRSGGLESVPQVCRGSTFLQRSIRQHPMSTPVFRRIEQWGKATLRPWTTGFTLLLVWLLLPAVLYPKLTQRLENDDGLRVGDRFYLNITSDVPLLKAVIPDTLTQFSVPQAEVISAGNDPATLRLTIVPLRLGRLSFPRLRIIPDGSGAGVPSSPHQGSGNIPVAPAESLFTDAFSINVLAVRAEGDTLLRDITPVQRYRLELPWWAYWTIIIVGVALLITIIVILLLRQPKAKVKPEHVSLEPDKRPPWKIAWEELSRLVAEELLEQGYYIEFHYRLSLVLRLYLELEYRFGAMEMTTSEIHSYFRSRSLSRVDASAVFDFLQYCDQVKFARSETDIERTEQRVEWLKQYLLTPAAKDQTDALSSAAPDNETGTLEQTSVADVNAGQTREREDA